MTSKIPATVVTGFLGAGKTSLIRHLLEHSRGRRLALLINEFGSLGIDRAIIGGCGIPTCREEDLIELANGCICCTVADDFLPAMNTILVRTPAPEHIIIETSGLALPKPLVQAFAWPEVKAQVRVDGVLVVVDAPAVLAGRFATDPAALAQQRAADPALSQSGPICGPRCGFCGLFTEESTPSSASRASLPLRASRCGTSCRLSAAGSSAIMIALGAPASSRTAVSSSSANAASTLRQSVR
jgi:CobW/HypB/UreG, nucleotide-binding domain